MSGPRKEVDVAVIGGGVVGAAIAYGLARLGKDVTVLDQGDGAIRASVANFGLIWVQGKGTSAPAYAQWTRMSARMFPAFADHMKQVTGIDVDRHQDGGLYICVDEADLESRVRRFDGLRDALNGDYPYELLDHKALKARLPIIGPDVAGATFHPEDGHVNPLKLLRALRVAMLREGVHLENDITVDAITPLGDGSFKVTCAGQEFHAAQVVIAAGLDAARLAPMVGLDAPVEAQRGQVLITERVRPFLDLPTGHVRQTDEGTVQIGDSKEWVGVDCGTTTATIGAIARRAVRQFPLLANVRMVRAWGGLRVLPPDGLPIYAESSSAPGAFVVSCHSGVSLAAAHVGPVAQWIAGGPAPFDQFEVFHGKRFAVSAPAAGH